MTQTLTKNKTLTHYVPGVEARAGVPAKPGVPARVINELKPTRIEVPASAMEALYRHLDRATGQYVWTNYRAPGSDRSMYITPYHKLRDALGRPGLTEAQAHYFDIWGLFDLSGVPAPVPLTWTSAWIEEERWVTTIIPAKPFVPAVPAVAGSPAIMTYDMHLGWNAGAHSAQVLEPGQNYEVKFTIGQSVGAVVGLARASLVAGLTRRSGYAHIETGVAVGDGKARLIRNGEFARNASGQIIEILGSVDVETFSLYPSLSTGVCEWYHDATGLFATALLDEGERYVLDAVLFAGDDFVDAPVIGPYEVNAGHLEGASKLRPLSVTARMTPLVDIALQLRPMSLRAGNAYSDAVLALPALQVIATMGGVSTASLAMQPMRAALGNMAQGYADLRLAPMECEAEGGSAWTPTYSIGALAMHPPVLGAVLLSGGVMTADLQLQPLWARLSERVHGEAVLGLEAMQVMGQIVTGTGPVDMVERMLPINNVTAQLYVTVVMAERLRGKDSAGLQVLAVASMLEQLEAGDSASVTQRALAFLLEQIGAMGPTRALTFRVDGDGWTLVDDSEGWAVNTETGASSRYQGYGYDSFATVNGRHLGVRANGIYLLEGDSDVGQPIHAGVHLGLQDFGTSQLKHLSNVYLGVSATGGLFIKVGVGEGETKQEYTYAARRVDPQLKTQRFDLGRGLRSNYFSFELVNDDGAGFELEKIEFVAVASDRRI